MIPLPAFFRSLVRRSLFFGSRFRFDAYPSSRLLVRLHGRRALLDFRVWLRIFRPGSWLGPRCCLWMWRSLNVTLALHGLLFISHLRPYRCRRINAELVPDNALAADVGFSNYVDRLDPLSRHAFHFQSLKPDVVDAALSESKLGHVSCSAGNYR